MTQKPAVAASPTPATIDAVNEAKTTAWNKHISAKAEIVQTWLKSDPGVFAYLTHFLSLQVDQLISGCKSRDDDQYVRGRIAMLRDILHLPKAVDLQIEAVEANKKRQSEADRDL